MMDWELRERQFEQARKAIDQMPEWKRREIFLSLGIPYTEVIVHESPKKKSKLPHRLSTGHHPWCNYWNSDPRYCTLCQGLDASDERAHEQFKRGAAAASDAIMKLVDPTSILAKKIAEIDLAALDDHAYGDLEPEPHEDLFYDI